MFLRLLNSYAYGDNIDVKAYVIYPIYVTEFYIHFS
jgi:hypothetical protein